MQIVRTIKLIYKIDKKSFGIVFILTIATGLTPVVSLLLSTTLLNSIQVLNNSFSFVLKIFIAYSLFTLISDFLGNVKNYFSNKLQILLNYKLNYLLMEKCSELSLEQLEDSETYDQITRLENDISSKPYQALQALSGAIAALTTFVSSVGILFTWKPWTIIIIVSIPLISALYYLRIGKAEFAMRYFRGNKERESWYLSYLMTHDFAFKEIKVNNLKNYFLKRYWKLKEEFIGQENNINKRQIKISSIFSVIQEIVNTSILLMAIYEAFQGLLLIGTVTAYIKAMGMIQSNTMALTNSLYILYNSNMYMKLLEEFFELPGEKLEGRQQISRIDSISINNVSYAYNNTVVLKNINLNLTKGNIVAIVGKNGSGKSTLMKIIAGLYTPKEGIIKVNSFSSKDIDKMTYRNRITVLFQDFLKLEMSLANNIALGVEDSEKDSNKINHILSNLSVDFLKNENNSEYKIDELLGNWFEGGQELSGGQWQKIALARVNYKDADLYLLDEPSSALDSLSETKIFDEFFKLSSEKIGLYITHKIGVAKKADKIIVLDEGEIVGVGTHNNLLKSCDVYKDLFEKEMFY